MTPEILVGLILGEGSFTMHCAEPALAIKMHIRHTHLLSSVQQMFGGRLYGPYFHDNRHYLAWHAKGKHLMALLPLLDQYFTDDLCPHVAARFRRMRAALMLRETPIHPQLMAVK